MEKILYTILFISLIGCKRELQRAPNINAKKTSDTLVLNDDKNTVIFIEPTINYLDSLKKTYKNEDDYYTIADDANFYIAEAGQYVIKNKMDTLNIYNSKVLKIGNQFIKLSQYKPWTLLLYQKGKQTLNISPISIEKEFDNFYSKTAKQYDNIEDVVSQNNFKNFEIIYKNTLDINSDGLEDYIVILQNNSTNNGRLLLLFERKKNNYKLILENKNIIPCEECGNGAESFYGYGVEDKAILFSSSYKSNEDIYKLDFRFRNDKSNYFVLDEVIIFKSMMGDSQQKKFILNQSTFNQIPIKDFNYEVFISNFVIK